MTTRAYTTALALSGLLILAGCAKSSTPVTPTTSSPIPTVVPSTGSPQPPSTSTVSPVPAESPVPTDSSPPGDIPDNAQFVPYHSKAGGFTISVPEGWSRTSTSSSVTFTDKLNTVVVSWQPAGSAPTVATARSTEVPTLQTTERAFQLNSVTAATLPAGKGVLINYQANSEPNPVTNKQYRLDVLRYELFNGGTEVAIGLRSPVGADNVDPWRIVTESFAWS